jgi:putative transposase
LQLEIGYKNTNLQKDCLTVRPRSSNSFLYTKDETQLKVCSEVIWLWVDIIESEPKNILAISISKERNMVVAENFLSGIVDKHGHQYPVSTADGDTWYPQSCHILKLKHHIHSPFEKSITERTMQYIKDRAETFDDYFPCKKNKCKLKHV